MTLPPSQQRALDAIDTDLRTADHRLARMFGVFTELTRLENMPLAESFQPVRWWTRVGRRAGPRQRSCTLPRCRQPGCRGLGWRWPSLVRARLAGAGQRPARRLGTIVLLPLLLAATLSLLLVSVLNTRPAGTGRCTQASSFIAPVRLAATGSCALGSQPRTSPAGG